jgi:flagellar hook protein FlgE
MAFSTAISGINAATSDLGVISNNIANSSTVGFKASRAQFAEIFANSLLGSGAGNTGQGVELTEVRTEFSQGNIEFTNNALDLAISGNGFFVISNNGAAEYTRAGSFRVDREGFLTNANGGRLQGFQVDELGQVTGEIDDLFIDTTLISPRATERVVLTSNLDSREVNPGLDFDPTNPNTYNGTTSTTIFDSLGNSHIINLYYVKDATTPNAYDVYTVIDGEPQYTVGPPPTENAQLQFTSNGRLDTAVSTGLTITGWQPLDANGAPNGSTPQDIEIDLTATTQFGTDFAVSSIVQDGFGAGQLISFSFDDTGVAFARYTNGQSQAIGQVALANFRNNNGLQPIGNTNYVETFASGSANIGEPGTAGRGAIQSSAVEAANVEITQELVNLIIAQRNFQANAQVISTEDQVTQSVINLR